MTKKLKPLIIDSNGNHSSNAPTSAAGAAAHDFELVFYVDHAGHLQ